MPVSRLWIGLGALSGLMAVGMAALAAHGLEAIGPARLQMLRNAVQMQGWHALALIGCGLWALRGGGVLANAAAAAFIAGTILFCGAVYGLSLAQAPTGFLVPFGGTLLMIGWFLLCLSAVFAR